MSSPFEIRHDWTVVVGDYCFGVFEFDTREPGTETWAEAVGGRTLIYVGKGPVFTNLPAYGVVSIAAITVLCLFAAISFAVAKMSHKRAGAR